ncbi:MAG: CCA tRNA nucleotidyltransferase [Deltaproteobacteria bacterium]|nr:CCA tRNA nucleotidyltransferase [Deltaproteobacteria bacterium]
MQSLDPIQVSKRISVRVLNRIRSNKPLRRFLVAFCRSVENEGGKSYLAGGIVRDMIAGRAGKDIDLMVSGLSFGKLGALLQSLPRRPLGIRRIMPVGKTFPVYKIWTEWAVAEIDVARTRGAGAREDAARRDFTINSLFFAFRTERERLHGTVLDYFGGIADLRNKLIRSVGEAEARFREDPLRILRAIRQKNERAAYSIERKTWTAIRRASPELLPAIPGVRVIDEILRSLSADPAGTVEDLRRSGIFKILMPETRLLRRGLFARMKRRYALLGERVGPSLPETVLLANLLVDIAEHEARKAHSFRLPRTEAIARRLHFPGVRNVARILEDLERLRRIRREKNRLAGIETVFAKWKMREQLLHLYEAASLAAGRKTGDFHLVLREADRRPALLSGRRLKEIGIPEGPGMDAVLKKVREATIAGDVVTAEEAERFAMEIHRRKSADRRRPVVPAAAREVRP